MINYIIQIVIFQILFLTLYDLFLSKETFFSKNRLYLLSTAFVSLVIPMLRFSELRKLISQEHIITLPEIVVSPQEVIEQLTWYKNISYLETFFTIGAIVFLIIFFIKILSIVKLIQNNEIQYKEQYKLVVLPKKTNAFSFFNYIFLGEEIPKEKQAKIIQHELVHSQQKHSIDLLFFEVLKIIMWFNPMIYLYQKRISLIHEFISDEIVTKNEEKKIYINNLLSEIFQVEQISFINQFYNNSFTKKRIIMMTKQKSKRIKELKYLLLVPVLVSMFFYTSCISKNDQVEEETSILSKNNNTKESNNTVSNKNVSMNNNIPFSVVDIAPTFPNCSKGNKECFNKEMRLFVGKNFNIDLANSLGLTAGKKRIFVQFIITNSGTITNIKARAPHPDLEIEAKRIVKLLPKFEPAINHGKTVSTKYILPIIFNVE